MKVASHGITNDDKKKIVKQIIHKIYNCLEEHGEVACDQGAVGMIFLRNFSKVMVLNGWAD